MKEVETMSQIPKSKTYVSAEPLRATTPTRIYWTCETDGEAEQVARTARRTPWLHDVRTRKTKPRPTDTKTHWLCERSTDPYWYNVERIEPTTIYVHGAGGPVAFHLSSDGTVSIEGRALEEYRQRRRHLVPEASREISDARRWPTIDALQDELDSMREATASFTAGAPPAVRLLEQGADELRAWLSHTLT